MDTETIDSDQLDESDELGHVQDQLREALANGAVIEPGQPEHTISEDARTHEWPPAPTPPGPAPIRVTFDLNPRIAAQIATVRAGYHTALAMTLAELGQACAEHFLEQAANGRHINTDPIVDHIAELQHQQWPSPEHA